MNKRESSEMISLPISLLLFVVVFSPLINGGTTHLPVTIMRLAILFLVAYWFISGVRKGVILLPMTAMDIPVILFVGLSVISLIWSPYTAMSLQWVISITSYALFFYLLVFYIRSPREIKLLAMVMIAIGLFETGVTVFQAISAEGSRQHGTFFNANFLAGYLSAISGIVMGLFLWGNKSEEWGSSHLKRQILYKVAMLCILGIFCISILLTESRGGMLSFLVMISFLMLFRLRYKALIVTGVLALLILITPNPLKERVKTLSATDPYAYSRIQIWENSLERISIYPYGTGLGIYKYTSQQNNFPIEGTISRYGKRAETAHNEYLQILVELGIAGLLIFIYGIYRLAREFKSALNNSTQMRGVLLGAAGGITAILSHAAVDSNLHEPSIVLLLILLSSLIIQTKRMIQTSGDQFREVTVSPEKKRFLYLVTALIIVGCTFLIIRPAMAWYFYAGAEKQIRSGNTIKAIDRLRLSTVVDPGNAAYHDHLANKLFEEYVKTKKQEYIEEAFEEVNYAVDLNPLNGKTFNHLGFLYHLRADYEEDSVQKDKYLGESIKAFEKAIELDPYSVFNYKEISAIYIKIGMEDKAVDYLKEAIAIEPNYLPARGLLVDLYMKQDKYELAYQEHNHILNIYSRYQNKISNSLENSYMDIDLAAVVSQVQRTQRNP